MTLGVPDELAVACPLCGARVAEPCNYVEGASHNGWVHDDRWDRYDRMRNAEENAGGLT